MRAAHIHEPGALPTCPDCHYGSATQRDDGRCADCGEAHDAEVVRTEALATTWRRVAAFRTAQWVAAAAAAVALTVSAGDDVAAWCDEHRDAAIDAQEAALDRDVREGRWAQGDAACSAERAS